jgi:hypothetical protein
MKADEILQKTNKWSFYKFLIPSLKKKWQGASHWSLPFS